MTTSENQNREVVEDLAKSLETTTALMQTLLTEIQDNAATLAVLREKFDTLGEKVQSLSRLVRDDNGERSIITRLVLIEKSLEDIDEDISELKTKADDNVKELHARISSVKAKVYEEDKTEQEFKRDKLITKLKLAASVVPGLIALGLVLVKFFLGAE